MIDGDETEGAAEAALGRGCIGRSKDDEPIFILVGRDVLAAEVVRDWARRFMARRYMDETFDQQARDKFDEAMKLADRMDEWRETTGFGKVPD